MAKVFQRYLGPIGLLVLLTICPANCQVLPQQLFSIWTTIACIGPANWTMPITSSDNYTFPVGIIDLYYKVNGLFGLRHCGQFCTPQFIVSGTATLCNFMALPEETSRLEITQFGDLLLNATELHLFPEPSLKGTPRIVNQEGLSGVNITVRSYFFTGRFSWNINNGQICLNHSIPDDVPIGITYEVEREIQVTSASFNLESNPGVTTTAGPTTINPTSTNPTTTVVPTSGQPCNATAGECSVGFQIRANSLIYMALVTTGIRAVLNP